MPPASPQPSAELRLTKQERTNVLKVLEKRQTPSAKERRASERVEYEPAAAPLVELHAPGALVGGSGFVVVARNLSSSGMAFLHGANVAPGTRCTVTMFDSRGEAEAVPGQVIRCANIAGRIHDVGVKFDRAVDAKRFLARPAPAPTGQAGKPAQAVERLCDAVLKLRELETSGWPGDRLRAALRDLADLCNTALKSVDEDKPGNG